MDDHAKRTCEEHRSQPHPEVLGARERIVFRSWTAQAAFAVNLAMALAFCVYMVVTAVTQGPWSRWVAPLAVAPSTWVLWKLARLRAELLRDGLRIVNTQGPPITVAWKEIDRFELGRGFIGAVRVYLVMLDGRRVSVEVLTGAWWVKWERWTAWTPTRRHLKLLNTALAQSREGWGNDAET